jgi:hypothetical protein
MMLTGHSAHAMVLAVCASACAVPEPGVPVLPPAALFPGYASYLTAAEARSQLPPGSMWTVIEDRPGPARDRCPRFDQFSATLLANDERHAGELTLVFINNRLEATTFEPLDIQAYIQHLEARGHAFKNSRDGRVARAESVTITVVDNPPAGGQRWVIWRDERLYSQVLRWIEACS